MSKFSQKYAIVQFFEEVTQGQVFSSKNWPLHSTVIDTFAINWTVDEMTLSLAKLLIGRTEFTSVAKEDMLLGEQKDTKVTLIELTDELANLHSSILNLLQEGGIVLNNPEFSLGGFLPHSTVQKRSRLTTGEVVHFNKLSIVDMYPHKDPYKREILNCIHIGEAD